MADRSLQGLGQPAEAAEQNGQGAALQPWGFLQQGVQAVYIGLQMLVMVQMQGFLVNKGFQGVIVVRQRRVDKRVVGIYGIPLPKAFY